MQAQTAYLLHLHHSGQASDVVFMDTDILVVDDLAAAFCQEFDYALTLSDAVDMPINIGMQVRGGLLGAQPAFPCLAGSLTGRALNVAVWGSLLAVQTMLGMAATLLCALAASDVELARTFQDAARLCCTMHSTQASAQVLPHRLHTAVFHRSRTSVPLPGNVLSACLSCSLCAAGPICGQPTSFRACSWATT